MSSSTGPAGTPSAQPSPASTTAQDTISKTSSSSYSYFPRHDTPLIPELITTERPENLDGYFDFVETILDKSFRDGALVHVALRTTKITSLEFNPRDTEDTGDAAKSVSAETTAPPPSSSSASSSSNGATSSSPSKKKGSNPGGGNKRAASPPNERPKAAVTVVPNHFIFSPRLIINRDGSTFGKFKIGTKVSVDDVVDCYQRVKIDTSGAVTMKATAGNLLNSGVSIDGLVQVNLLEEAVRDELSVKASMEREAVCFSMLGSRDGAGATALKADGDVRLFNLHIGCGVEHHWAGAVGPAVRGPSVTTAADALGGGGAGELAPSQLDARTLHQHQTSLNGTANPYPNPYPYHQPSSVHSNIHNTSAAYGGGGGGPGAHTSTLYVGAGCFGKGWHMAAKLFRDDGEWTEAQIVLYQNIHKLASIAAVYKVNTQEGIAETTIGVSRRFKLWGHKLVVAAKFSTSGLLSLLTEVNIDKFTRIGLVSRFTPGRATTPTFGILASLQSD